MAGTTAGDIAQISFGYGLFTGAFGLHYGLEKIGALVVPLSSGNTQRQLELMQDFGVTVLVSTPSYAMYLAEEAQKSGIETDKLSLRLGLFGAEPSTAEFRKVLAKKWGITATHNYGLSEVMGPGVAGECTFLCGMHINEDYFLVEALDPKTLEPVPPGEEGELVITPLTKEGLPLLRYRTRDIASLTYEPCPCGRTTARIKKIKGRSDDMLIIRGVNVFPSQVETVLLEVEGVSPNYRIIVKREGYLDVMEIEVEIDESHFTDRFRDLKKIKENVEEKLYNVLNLHVPVRLLEAGSLPRSVGKAQRIVDLRKEE
jgi:phenylacetate-CoA ligase